MEPEADAHNERLLKALVEIGQELASTIELEALLDRILRISREVFQFENAIIRLLDVSTSELITAASYGYDDATVSPAIRLGQGVMGQVALSGEPVLVADVTVRSDYVPGIPGARSELAVPLMVRERVIGVFNVESCRPNAFSDADIAPLMTMAGQAAIAIENARLYENLRSMSERYRSLHQFNDRILQSAGVGIYAVDEHLRITSWNRKIEEMSGISADEALGRNLFALLPGLESEGFAVRLRRVLEVGAPEKLRLAHRNLMGELRFQKRRLAPLKEGERTTGVLVIVEDVTEFKRLLEQTVQSEKLAEVGRLSAGIAHEINNPLAVLSYAAQLLLREDLSADQKELAERIDSEVDRLKALTGGLLTFSSSRETRKRAVNLNEVLADVLRLVRYEFSRRSITLHEELGTVPLLLADPNKLKQVFINLTINAAQAMKRSGTLTVRTETAAGGEVVATVSDTGPGIPPAVRKQLFTPFFSTKREGEGTGLGLYICRTIVVEHGGRIDVESQEGVGSTFRVVLPPLEVPAT